MSANSTPVVRRAGSFVRRAPRRARQWIRCDARMVLVAAGRGQAAPRPSAVRVVRASEESLSDLAAFQSPRQIAEFRSFLEEGQVGYLGYLGDECVHRSWLVPGPAVVSEHWAVRRDLRADEAYVHYCETASSARGFGAFPAVLTRIAADNPERRLLMAIAADNSASLRAATKAGWLASEEVCVRVRWGRRNIARHPVPGKH